MVPKKKKGCFDKPDALEEEYENIQIVLSFKSLNDFNLCALRIQFDVKVIIKE